MTQFVHRAVLDALVDLSPDPSWAIDGAGVIVAANSAYQRWQSELAPQLAELQRRALQGRSIHINVRVSDRTFAVHGRPVESGGVAFTARVVEEDDSERSLELSLMRLFASNASLPVVIDKALE